MKRCVSLFSLLAIFEFFLQYAVVFLRGSGGATAPPEIFLAPSLVPHFSRKVQNIEFRMYCLLQIHAN